MSTQLEEPLAPHSPEGERGLLGCLLAGASVGELRRAGLSALWFYELRHRKVFEAIAAVAQDGGMPDLAAVGTKLIPDRDFPDSTHFLAQLAAEAVSAENAFYWLEKLRDKAQRRAVINAATRLEALARDESTDPAVVFNDAEAALQCFRQASDADALPDIVSATDLLSQSMPLPEELVSGVLHRGSKLILGGSSKSCKTWSLTDLAVSVATGAPWLGFDTTAGRVLYVNLEIQPAFFRQRIADVARVKRVELNGNFEVWNLRGFAADYRTLLPKIRGRIKDAGHALLVIDPIYKLLGSADENRATDISALLNAVEDLAVTTGAAVAMAGHFAKGNAAGKETIDRISGSGVFARDPDSLVIFTRHETEGAFTVEMVLRNFAPVAPFVVRWDYPLFKREAGLDPARLKQVGGRKAEHAAKELLEVLPAAGLENKAWLEIAADENGITERTFYRLRSELLSTGKVLKSKVNGKWVPISKANK